MTKGKEINEIRDKIVEGYNPERIILFGSFAWGKPSSASDVDILVVKNTDKPQRFRTTDVERILDLPPLPVDVLVRTPQEIKKREEMGDPFIKNILKKGKEVYKQK